MELAQSKLLIKMKNMNYLDKHSHEDGNSPLRFDISRSRQARVGQNLRCAYDDVVAAPIPENLMELLKSLDDEDGA